MSTQQVKLVREGKLAPYQDARENLWITVTADDVRRSARKDCNDCAMAKATCRAYANALSAAFYTYAVYIEISEPGTGTVKTLRYIPSEEARRNIRMFDKTGKFVPGRYLLLAPTKTSTLKAIRKRSAERKGRHKQGKGVIRRNASLVVTMGRVSDARDGVGVVGAPSGGASRETSAQGSAGAIGGFPKRERHTERIAYAAAAKR